MQEYRFVLFGFIFDLSLEHFDGQRVINIVKSSVVDFIADNIVSDDKTYFYSPTTHNVPKNGHTRALIAKYEPELINYGSAIKHINTVFDREDLDAIRCIALITNRFTAKQQFGLTKGFNKSSSLIGVFSQQEPIIEDPHLFYPLNYKTLNLDLADFLKKAKNDY